MYDPRADSVDKSKGTIKPGLKLGEYKKGFFEESALDAFYQDLKQEGITDELKDAKKTGQNTETENKEGISITTSGTDIKVSSKEEPAEVMIDGKQDNSNLLVIEVKVERKNIGFKNLSPIKTEEKEYTITEDDYSKGMTDFVNFGALTAQTQTLTRREAQLTALTTNFKAGIYSGATTSFYPNPVSFPGTASKMITAIKATEDEIKELQGDIKDTEKGGNKIKITCYYSKDNKGSKVNNEFTLTANGLE
jgi:hypothetical protein